MRREVVFDPSRRNTALEMSCIAHCSATNSRAITVSLVGSSVVWVIYSFQDRHRIQPLLFVIEPNHCFINNVIRTSIIFGLSLGSVDPIMDGETNALYPTLRSTRTR